MTLGLDKIRSNMSDTQPVSAGAGKAREAMKYWLVASFALLLLPGCMSGGSSTPINTAFAPSSTPTAGSAVAGIVGGGLVMASNAELTRQEQLVAIDAEYHALETAPAGEPVEWSDETTGNNGTVTAAQPYRVGSQDCRPYSHVIRAEGAPNSLRGTACRNPDGSWTLLN